MTSFHFEALCPYINILKWTRKTCRQSSLIILITKQKLIFINKKVISMEFFSHLKKIFFSLSLCNLLYLWRSGFAYDQEYTNRVFDNSFKISQTILSYTPLFPSFFWNGQKFDMKIHIPVKLKIHNAVEFTCCQMLEESISKLGKMCSTKILFLLIDFYIQIGSLKYGQGNC